ncbi:hypothetical protein C0J52_18755 [Blattella germanica]|nr:hypothetical protein C0J52_18755 [Blattella germanica]
MEGKHQCLIVLFIFYITLPSLLSEKCFSRSQNLQYYLATKTPYRYTSNSNDSFIHYPGCEPLRIWMMIRHGTRYPSSKVIRLMRERLPQIRDSILQNHKSKRGKLCNEEIAELQAWSPHVEEADQKRLSHEGEDEMVELAERFQNRFPQILPEVYNNSTFKFRHTATQRASESARHFAVGLFGRRVSRYVWFPEAIYKDPILRFYKLCQRWRVEVDKNPESMFERIKFEEGPEMSTTLKDVSYRLGFNQTINIDDAVLMFVTCSFETAWDHRARSPWCAAFSEHNMKNNKPVTDRDSPLSANDVPVFCRLPTRCRAQPSKAGKYRILACGRQLKVLTMHQERPVILPGCPKSDLCPIKVLKDQYNESFTDCNFDQMCGLHSDDL